MYYFRCVDPVTGKRPERACHTGDYNEAVRVLERAIAGRPPEPVMPKTDTNIIRPEALATGVTVGEVLDDYMVKLERKAKYRGQGDPDFDVKREVSGARGVISRLRARLGHLGADQLTTADTEAYRRIREDREGVLFTTVNHDLAYLRAALNDGAEMTPPKVTRVPKMWFPTEESRVREGFIERQQYLKIFEALPDHLKALFVCAFHTGARGGELKKIRWSMVDFEKRIIQVRAKTAKNKTGRYLPIWGDMLEVLQWQKEVRDRECPDCEWVFFWHMNSGGRAGARLGRHDIVFRRVVASIGLPGLILHDMRRSAIKYANQEAGIDKDNVKLMSGHKSDAVFRRYNISGAREIVKMGADLDTYLASSGGSKGLHLVDRLKTA